MFSWHGSTKQHEPELQLCLTQAKHSLARTEGSSSLPGTHIQVVPSDCVCLSEGSAWYHEVREIVGEERERERERANDIIT